MVAAKHHYCLTKHKYIESNKDQSANVFVFNTHTKAFDLDWLRRNIVKNDGIFIIQDSQHALTSELSIIFNKKNYFITEIDAGNPCEYIYINPFDLVHDTSEIHFLFSNFLYALWDNSDPDISIMSILTTAFASTVYYVFNNNKEKRTMSTLVKMVQSMNAKCIKDGETVPVYEALFMDNPDPSWIPKKYYLQFCDAAGERKTEIANKVKEFFSMIPESAVKMMSRTSESISASLYFKTVFSINANSAIDEAVAKMIFTLLITLSERTEGHMPITAIIPNLDGTHLLLGLPKWMSNSIKNDIDFLIFNDSLVEFQASEHHIQYMTNIKKNLRAAMFIHRNKKAEKEQAKLSDEDKANYHNIEYVATVTLHDKQEREDDEVF